MTKYWNIYHMEKLITKYFKKIKCNTYFDPITKVCMYVEFNRGIGAKETELRIT